MRKIFQHIGLAKLCEWFGISRQAYYQDKRKEEIATIKEAMVIKQVEELRRDHPRIGGRKLYFKLRPFMEEHDIKLGRDGLFTLLAAHHLLIKNRKRKIQTTLSYHRFRKYPNLIKGFTPSKVNQLWVSDITYWQIEDKHYYITLITDAYSHKIVGYHVGESLETMESIQALRMALLGLEGPKVPSWACTS